MLIGFSGVEFAFERFLPVSVRLAIEAQVRCNGHSGCVDAPTSLRIAPGDAS
jgi:hypothetical protein